MPAMSRDLSGWLLALLPFPCTWTLATRYRAKQIFKLRRGTMHGRLNAYIRIYIYAVTVIKMSRHATRRKTVSWSNFPAPPLPSSWALTCSSDGDKSFSSFLLFLIGGEGCTTSHLWQVKKNDKIDHVHLLIVSKPSFPRLETVYWKILQLLMKLSTYNNPYF